MTISTLTWFSAAGLSLADLEAAQTPTIAHPSRLGDDFMC